MNTIPPRALPLTHDQRNAGWAILEVILCLLFMGVVLFFAVRFPWDKLKAKIESEDRCPPVSSPTGQLLCYSGGTLVYQTETYRNGGVLCSSSGVEIKTIQGDAAAFCIEESTQGSVWDPPIGAER